MDSRGRDQAGEILVVDDAPENLIAIEAALTGMSKELVLASSGQEALRYLLERDFALILLDVQMPTMNGLETARMIRQRERSRHVPIIFITAHDSNDAEVLEAYRLSAVDFLFKPITAEVLRAKASVFVELQRRTAQVARQALQIKEHQQAERDRALAEQRRHLEAQALRKSLVEQKKHALALTQKNLELEHTHAQLEALNARLAEDDRRKDEFIAVLAHELRNPLAAVISGIELLKTDPSPNKVAIVRPIMERQGRHLIRLVDDLLDTSRITSGKMKLRTKLVLLDEILDDAVKLALPGIEAGGHTLELECRCANAQIRGDGVRLAQMVANLLSNAARYTDPGGHIRLSADRDDASIRIIVKDNGRGMSSELVPRVFDMFVQAEDDGAGLGIGLTLVRELTQMHGGEVLARSEGLGQGSEFEIRLPEDGGLRTLLRSADGSPIELPLGVRPAGVGGLRVALIDDYDDGRGLTRSMLERWGHAVIEAGNGTDGVALVVDERPDVAIIDIGLPDIDGYEVARQLRARLGSDGCPRLIAMTGFGRPTDRERAREAGFDTHLSKPAESAELRAAMYETYDRGFDVQQAHQRGQDD